jgi:hypothetical protein
MARQERNMVELRIEEFQERRKGTRTPFITEVILSFNDGQADIVGELQDISIFGLFLETDRAVAAGSSCTVRIVVSAKNSRLIIQDIEGSIVRSDRRGLGIQFEARFEWYVIFKIYTHFSRNGTELDAASLAEHFGIGEFKQQ